MGYVIMFLIISLLILIHESGHFCAAKWIGIPVTQFSVGYGPKLWGFTYKGTEYRISAIPIGGYVMPDIEALSDYFAFSFKGRVLFSVAGPFTNLMAAWLGLVLISIVNCGFGFNSVFITPIVSLWEMTAQIVQSIPMLVRHPGQLSGVVGLVAFGGQQVGVDVMKILSLSVLLNINLAFLNLLPMLPLDGGKILLDVLQRLRLPVQRIYVPVALTGWVLLLGLMVYVTVQDVSKLCA